MNNILDHGYMDYVEHWGSDARIVEAARMSTGKGFLGWDPGLCEVCGGTGRVIGQVTKWINPPSYKDGVFDTGEPKDQLQEVSCPTCNGNGKLAGDAKLLKYLWTHKHGTPFEMAGLTIIVQAPIMVFREWHRHRTQCAMASTLVHFDAPKTTEKRRFVQKQTLAELYRKWQPTRRSSRPGRQKNSCYTRERIHNMQLRMLNESTGEVEYTRIMDVILGQPKLMVEVTVESGKKITTSLDHRYFTDIGWLTLEQAIDNRARLSVETTLCGKPKSWEVEHNWDSEIWKPIRGVQVSSEGRINKTGEVTHGTENTEGYPVINLAGEVTLIHTLVLEAFVGSSCQEVRHLNNNRADCRLKNLAWGSSKENAQDRIISDRQQRLRSGFERITNVRSVGLQDSYDLTVEGPFHNFVADGFVVHNSYNEMSARYTPLPNLNYVPTIDRCLMVAGKSRQSSGTTGANELTHEKVLDWLDLLDGAYETAEVAYQYGLQIGIPKELARLSVPVGRYSRMMASTDLRNWLAFLTLRMDVNAQWEIRQYANQVGAYIQEIFPKTWELYVGNAA